MKAEHNTTAATDTIISQSQHYDTQHGTQHDIQHGTQHDIQHGTQQNGTQQNGKNTKQTVNDDQSAIAEYKDLKTLSTATRDLFKKNITEEPQQTMHLPKCKTSYGIICYNKGRILLVKKPVTYHFCEFMVGHYQTCDTQHLKFLFSNMTYHEKRAILDMNFDYLWRYVYRMPINATYTKKKNKFDLSFSAKRLAELIAGTPNVDLMWEAPKGRKNQDETDIAAAIREFHEETGFTLQDYNIKWDLTPIVERFEDLGTVYQNVYWLAEAIQPLQQTIQQQPMQQQPFGVTLDNRIIRTNNGEVADCAWVTLADITPLNMNITSHARLIALIKKTCDRFKIIKKSKIYHNF
jgi:8-oxo-dGTP pyrophosphatase MutT (NUDIX family)